MIAEPPVVAPPNLYPFQRDAIQKAYAALHTARGFYIQHDPGMGKTLDGILLMRLLGCQRILVVTTKAGLGVWRREIARWWPDAPHVGLINWDRVDKASPADLLILDEAHYAKNGHSQRSRAVQRLSRAARHTLLLSGTPAHSPLDYHAQYRMIDPQSWPWCLKPSEYKQLICNLSGPYGNWLDKHHPFKPQMVRRVEEIMATHTHKAVKEEMHLPEPIETVVPVQLDSHERAAYTEMEKKLVVELPPAAFADAPIVLSKILRLQQITSGFLKDTQGVEHAIGTSKLDVCAELLEERRVQHVVVAFRFGWEKRALQERLETLKIEHACIDGSTSDNARTGIVGMFQEGRLPVLLLQYQAGGTSITLTKADAMIFLSMTSSVIEWEQIKARIHRIGTMTHVQYLYLLVDNSVDVDLFNGLKAKADVVALTSLLRGRLDQ